MANWKNGEFEIDGMIVTADTKIEEFKKSGKYDVDDSDEEIMIVRSAPNTVNFINGEFLADFDFDDGRIWRIKLRPLLRDCNSPGYPDEEYQEKKWNYCKKLLKEAYGEVSKENELKAVYEFNGGVIFTGKVVNGHAAYTGGNIYINFGR